VPRGRALAGGHQQAEGGHQGTSPARDPPDRTCMRRAALPCKEIPPHFSDNPLSAFANG
jgi:hypothetical protein